MSTTPDVAMRLLTRLRGRVALKADMKGVDMDAQLADYASELTAYEPAVVEAACLGWSRKSKWWPALAELLEAADEAKLKRGHQRLAQAKPRAGENFIQRCQRLGFHAGRMSTIGNGAWKNIWERSEPDRERPRRWEPLTDEQVVQALQWCEEHPGVTWKPIAYSTPEEIIETMRLVLQMEANPEAYFAPATPALIAIGRTLIQRHIDAGRAPADVVAWFSPVEAAP